MRLYHRALSPFIFFLVAVSALTGVVYRVGKTWFGLGGSNGQDIMAVHTGAWLSPDFSPYYVLIVGIGVIFLLVSGTVLAWRSRSKVRNRRFHRWLGMILLLPLGLTALSGSLYAMGETWFGFSEDTLDLLMKIHEGGWLGRQGKTVYVLLLGLGTLGVGLFGLSLLGKRPQKSVKSSISHD